MTEEKSEIWWCVHLLELALPTILNEKENPKGGSEFKLNIAQGDLVVAVNHLRAHMRDRGFTWVDENLEDLK
jgi:hypothetical protein